MRVWVTRDEGPDGPLSTALRGAGLTPVLEPVLERCVVGDATQAISRLGPDDWLVLTSAFAVDAVGAAAARVPRVAVVGAASEQAARAKGLRVELVSPAGDAASLFGELRATTRRGTVCYPRSSLAKPPAPWPGVEVVSPVLYETRRRAFDRGTVDRIDVVSVASPSAVEAVGVVRVPYASIGPTTSAALRRIGVEPWVEAPQRGFASLAEAIAARAADERT